jgi:predicted PurR-regulated permease PerM
MSRPEFITRCFIVLAIALVPILVWYLFDVILICVSALLLSELLALGAEPFIRRLKFPRQLALALSSLLIFAGVGGAVYLFGSRVVSDLQNLIQNAQSGQGTIISSIQSWEIGKLALEHIHNQADLVGMLPRVFTISLGFVGAMVVVIVAGVFFAAQPQLYLSGLVQLFPPRLHGTAEDLFWHIGRALRLWLLGQFIEMVVIGLLTLLAAWLLGLPSPFALGLIAGLAEFVPYVGPIISAIPAVLVAATQSMHAVLWTIVAYTLIHQAEGHLIMPYIQQRMIFVPPAVILLSIVAIGSLFGIVAIPLATPLAVICFVVTSKLYVRDALGEDARLPGESRSGT